MAMVRKLRISLPGGLIGDIVVILVAGAMEARKIELYLYLSLSLGNTVSMN